MKTLYYNSREVNWAKKGLIFINKILNHFLLIIIFLTIFISIFFIPTINNQNITIIDFIDTGDLLWPAPGYYTINSYFGKRSSPTSGASTYHRGVDIGAPQGSSFVAVTSGTITYVGFLGGGGYTITLTDSDKSNGEIKYTYCHCDPNFIVSINDVVVKGQIIGYVGPKYVYGVVGNQYHDSSGKPTNGATTGPHLHFGMRINNEYVNPLDYLPSEN